MEKEQLSFRVMAQSIKVILNMKKWKDLGHISGKMEIWIKEWISYMKFLSLRYKGSWIQVIKSLKLKLNCVFSFGVCYENFWVKSKIRKL